MTSACQQGLSYLKGSRELGNLIVSVPAQLRIAGDGHKNNQSADNDVLDYFQTLFIAPKGFQG
jgi:hypothetical protein